MANKRMFSLNVVDTDKFLEMPISSRLLYYELGMRADDDGFVDNWKKILMFTGLKEDDMKVLISKQFILPFESGVIVIRHWRLNNYLQKDRIKPTIYQEELSQLGLDENDAYILENNDIKNVEIEKTKKTNIGDARQKRIEAKKESDLPYSFEYKIRNAFIGKICPICNREMNATSDKNKPTIQHNKPISLGGKHELDNISVICSNCNCSIQNRVETPPYNTEEVKKIWECIRNVYIDKNSIVKNSIEYNNSSNIYDFLQENGFVLSPIHYEIVQQWEDNDLTRYAIKQAVLNNKYNIKYVESILNSYKKNNIQTIQQAKEREEEFNKNKGKNNFKEQNIPEWMNQDLGKGGFIDDDEDF